MRQQRRDVHTYVSAEAGANPAGDVVFSVGSGRVCRNVSIVTSFVQLEKPGETKVVCLVDGEHEYNHTVAEEHSVEVVGYAESGVHDGAGGTTPRPRNDRPLSSSMAAATVSENWTINGAAMLGSRVRARMRWVGVPSETCAVT